MVERGERENAKQGTAAEGRPTKTCNQYVMFTVVGLEKQIAVAGLLGKFGA